MIQKKKFSDAIAANISVLEGLLPTSANDTYWVNTLDNGGKIAKSIVQTGVKTMKIISGIGNSPSMFEVSIYSNYSIIGTIIYAQGNNLVVSKTIKGGNNTFKMVLKNNSIYVTTDTNTKQLTISVRKIDGIGQIVMEESDDDLSSPTSTTEL